jgi:glycerophosphoryl diester phosphodiesterase
MIQRIGHRGAAGYITENTIPSFEKALELHVDAIELDVHICASGELVVFHDFTVDRLTNGSGEINKLSLQELKALQINNQYQIPTLEEVLQLIDKRCWINIELKGRNTATSTLELVKKFITEYNWTLDHFLISSFQREELETLRNLDSFISMAILTNASVEQAIDWATELQAKAIHPHFSLLTFENCLLTQEKGFQINTWTVNESATISHMKQFPINGIISDFPDLL